MRLYCNTSALELEYEKMLLEAELSEPGPNGMTMVNLKPLKARVREIGRIAHLYERRWKRARRLNWILGVSLSIALVLMLTGCASSGGGSDDAPASTVSNTRTVCVAAGSEDLIPYVQRSIDAWNEGDTRPLSETCTEFVRCLPKAVAHELGHALGLGHTESGLMHPDAVRSPTPGVTAADLAALPDDAPMLLYYDTEQPCDHEVAWGYPQKDVGQWEVAWYERSTRKIWIDPAQPWRY